MHSSHVNHHYNTHPSPHHHQQQPHSGGCSLVAADDKCETMQQCMKPPHRPGSVSISTTSAPFLQANKNNYYDGSAKHPPQKPSATIAHSAYNHNGVQALNHRDSATLDDFDIMLLHEDFPHLLMIAAKVKSIHRTIAKILSPPVDDVIENDHHHRISTQLPAQPRNATYRPKNALLPDEVLRAVERMQQVLIHKKPSDKSVISRGFYPITDSLMEDAMIVLQQEYDSGQNWLIQYEETTKQVETSSTFVPFDAASHFHGKRSRNDLLLSSDSSSNTATGGPITIKYAKWQTDALMNWMIENKDQPFPDTDAIELLVQQTGLTNSQIVNWTTNVRKRNRKATCENGKKPHHFLDFLFLVHDRETKKANTASATAAAEFAGTFVDKNYHEESRMMYGQSPRLKSTVSQFSESLHNTSPKINNGNFISPVEPFLPSRSHQEHNARVKMGSSNRYVFGDSSVTKTISRMGDEMQEPIPLLAQSNDEIMVDFADCWLNDDRLFDMEIPHAQVLDRHGGIILHSVTDDSHDDFATGHNDSLPFSLGGIIDGDDYDDDMLLDKWESYARSLY